MSKKNILIIGGGGFIGLNLSLKLKDKFNIYIVSRYNIFLNDILTSNPEISLISNKISDISLELLNLYNFDSIIWLAHNSVPASNKDLLSGISADLNPLILFLEIIKLYKFRLKFIYFSSGGAIYGNTNLKIPIQENSDLNPISNYGYCKLICENTIKYCLLNTSINCLIIRPSNVYGPLQNSIKPQGLISHIFNCIYNNIELNLYDDGNITRDYIHINDLCNFIGLSLEHNNYFNFEVINVGSSIPTKNLEIINIIEKLTKKDLRIIYNKPRPFDCFYNVLDTTKAKFIYDWRPTYSLHEGIENYWTWFLNNLNE